MSLPDGSAAIWVVATRIQQLDLYGFVDPSAQTYTTAQLIKATVTPVMATGDDIEVKVASGDLAVFAKHGDMRKYLTMSIELATPDPALEQLLCGGTLLSSSAATLGTPTGLTVTPQTTLGSLPAGIYGYRATQYNSFGETLAEADVQATTTGSTGATVVSGVVLASGALGCRIYGRTVGGELLLGSYVNIGTQATSAVSGTGTVTTLTVTGLTKAIPNGYQFQIAGDTNTTKIVFTTLAFGPVGATTLAVSASQSVTTTIAAGNIVPVFVDTGVLSTAGQPSPPLADSSAGPGIAGYQGPALGSVNAQIQGGVSVEFFEKAILGGSQATIQPYWRYLYPAFRNGHIMPKDHTNANAQTIIEGQCFENPNFGSGGFLDWPFDSSKVDQRQRCGAAILPVPSYQPTLAYA
jgi:hypothetical protein